ncbi:MAG TPA: DUF481 domain-containing protein [Polyangiaceae bacterium]
MIRPSRALVGLAPAIVLALAPVANAQVNTEILRARIHDQGTSLVLQGTLDGHTGNTSGLTADGLLGAGFASGPHLTFAFASADYSKLNGTLGVDKSFAHARYDYEFLPWLWWEAFAQAQSDHFQRIEIRQLLGTGPRFGLYRDEQIGIYLGVAYMFEHDVTSTAPGQTGEWQPVAERLSTYLTAHAKLSDGVDAVVTTYLQPRIDAPSDVRVLTDCGFVFKVGSKLSTSVTFTGHYDSRPPPGVLPADTELKNAIALTL